MSEAIDADTYTDTLEEAQSDAGRLAQTGIVGERQALAYALRELHGVGRQETANIMETSASNVDNLLWTARAHIGSAHDIVAIVGDKIDD